MDYFEKETTDFPICPYCNEKELYWWEFNMDDGEIQEINCEHCGRNYELQINISHQFLTRKLIKEEEDED